MKDPAFLFYPSDFLTGTMAMPFEERGKYITLLCFQHQSGRMSEETIRFLVGSFSDMLRLKFSCDENGLFYNHRLEEEIKKRTDFIESRRNNGRLGGRPKNEEKPLAKPNGKPKQNLPEDINENENEVKIEVISTIFSFQFQEVWNELLQMPKWRNKPFSAVKKSLKQLEVFDERFAIGLVEKAIAGNYQGVVFSNTETEYLNWKQKSNGTGNQKQQFGNNSNSGVSDDYKQSILKRLQSTGS